MKISYYTNQISRPGGLERVLIEKANAWIQKGYEVEVITFSQNGKKSFYNLDKRGILSDLEIPYRSKKSNYSPTNLLILPLHLFRLIAHLKASNPDIILVANCRLEFFFFPFIPIKAKIIKEEHLSHYLSKKQELALSTRKKLYRWLYKKILSYYDQYIVLNQEEIKYGPINRTTAIPNPINKSDISFVTESEREKVILSAGRLSSVKQYGDLIEIFREVSKTYPDWKLKILGEGGQREKLEAKIISYGLEHQIFLPGNSDKVYKEMRESSIFALTSKTEGFSMVLVEAMSNGLPVVSYDSPHGPGTIIQDQIDGFLVPLNDKEEFVKLLSLLIRDRELRNKMAEKGRENVLRFETKEVMKEWDRLFRKLGFGEKLN